MVANRDLYIRFESLCARVLKQLNYDVEQNARIGTDTRRIQEVDIVARRDGRTYLINVKWTSYQSIDLQRLRDWSAQTAGMHSQTNVSSVLMVSGRVDEARKQWAEQEYRIQVWDRDFLLIHGRSAGLNEELNTFFQESDKAGKAKRARKVLKENDSGQNEELGRPLVAPGADELISLLESIEPGRNEAKRYEECCRDIIEYLFGEHLLDARPQNRLDDGLSYLDIVYRVNPSHLFWETLTRDFRARVVVFECKNYSEPLGPLEVYTTERYMSLGALRPICFVLSRKPVHAHAELAAFGAMRELGKLLIFLSDEDLIAMLRIRAAQLRDGPLNDRNDPTVLLDQKIYDFIARLPR